MSGALRMDEAQYSMKMIENELMMNLSYEFMPPADVKIEPYVPETAHGPYIQIIEEPKQRGFRFRYECEGPSHGGLPGASSERNRRTYPTVKVSNYVGIARVEVQLVTHSDPPQVHAHSLVGRQCCTESGICILMGCLALSYLIEQAIGREAKELGKIMDLNIVRLKFTAYLQDSNGGFSRALKPVVSNPIYDSKSPNASNLKISRMDKTSGSVLGGDEIFLLCDKVQKDDIEIRFYEEDDGSWEAFGDFSPTDVHKQYAIVFKTPPYHSAEIERQVTVFLQLKRKKGGDCSDPKQFTYVPRVQDKEEVQRKKQKPISYNDQWRGPLGGAGGAGRGAGGFGGGAGGGAGGGEEPRCTYLNSCFCRAFVSLLLDETLALSVNPCDSYTILLFPAATLQSRATRMSKQTAGALLQYCTTGDVRVLLAMQRHLCGVQDKNGDTPLHLAIIHQQSAVTQQLVHTLLTIQQHKVLNKLNHLGQTPLHLAVITRQVKVVDVLLRAGADPTLLDRDGRNALHLAALAGDDVTLRVLLGHLGERYLHLVNMADYHGLHPLHLAVCKGGERCLRLLVEGGAKINAPEQKSGCSALHLAVRENYFKVACTLITELKADVNMCTFGGNTPLHLAASRSSPPLCSMLIAAGEMHAYPLLTIQCMSYAWDVFISVCLKRGYSKVQILLDSETLSKLCELLSLNDVPWRQLAEKLNMLSLAHLYQESPLPCHNLLENYQVSKGGF
uniref:RHD domain-containing protein n=1 Tax=Oncorhynchus tshawytscha TaxID=74940 RepID=A0A8C8EH35_ONCTS